MDLIQLRRLYEMYIKSRNSCERGMIIESIESYLVEINQIKSVDIIEIDRLNNKIKYKYGGDIYNFYFIGNTYYINGLKLKFIPVPENNIKLN